MILSNVGARSTLHSVSCFVFVLVILLAAGPLFAALPLAVLAAMVAVAMKNLLLQVTQLPYIWRSNKPDFIIWMLTCLVSVFVDLKVGIIAGIGVSILTIIVRSQLASGSVGALSVTEDMVHLNGSRKGLKASKSYVIFYFPSQLYFATADRFKQELFSKVVDPECLQNDTKLMNGDANSDSQDSIAKAKGEFDDLKYIILECSAMTYIDLSAADMLKTVVASYQRAGVNVLLANCPDYSLNVLERTGFFAKTSRDCVYYDIYDAVNFVTENYSSHRNGDMVFRL